MAHGTRFAWVALAFAPLSLPAASSAQSTTMGLLLNTPAAFDGYSLFAPMPYTETYLIDNAGLLVHSWPGTHRPGNMGYTPSGNSVFRVCRYAPGYPGFDGRDLTPGDPIELYLTGIGPVVARSSFDLRQNYPNPFRPLTTISFTLRETSRVSLEIHDVAGRLVATIVNESLGAGEHHRTWRAHGLASGVYLYTLNVGSESRTRRMIALR